MIRNMIKDIEHNITLDADGFMTKCPNCGADISWSDYCRDNYAYFCDNCSLFFEHVPHEDRIINAGYQPED